MKKYILVTFISLCTLFGAHAEAGDIAVAPQFAFATKHATAGFGLQAQFDATDNVRVAPEFIFYFKSDNITSYNGNINVHYLIPKSEKVTFYPLAGLSYGRYKIEWKDENGEDEKELHDRLGANFGAGAVYKIQEQLDLFAEERFQLMKDFTQSVTVLGVRFTF